MHCGHGRKKRNIECKNGNGRPAHQKVRGPDGLGRERMGDEWDGSARKNGMRPSIKKTKLIKHIRYINFIYKDKYAIL